MKEKLIREEILDWIKKKNTFALRTMQRREKYDKLQASKTKIIKYICHKSVCPRYTKYS